jgi:hypothetical protein
VTATGSITKSIGFNDIITIDTASFATCVGRYDVITLLLLLPVLVIVPGIGFHFTLNQFEFPLFKFKTHDSNISHHRFHLARCINI